MSNHALQLSIAHLLIPRALARPCGGLDLHTNSRARHHVSQCAPASHAADLLKPTHAVMTLPRHYVGTFLALRRWR